MACFQRDLDMWIPGIFEVLERVEDLHMLSASLDALEQLRPPTYTVAAVPPLVKALSSSHWGVRACAARLQWR